MNVHPMSTGDFDKHDGMAAEFSDDGTLMLTIKARSLTELTGNAASLLTAIDERDASKVVAFVPRNACGALHLQMFGTGSKEGRRAIATIEAHSPAELRGSLVALLIVTGGAAHAALFVEYRRRRAPNSIGWSGAAMMRRRVLRVR